MSKVVKLCEWCRKPIELKIASARFCSVACRSAGYRQACREPNIVAMPTEMQNLRLHLLCSAPKEAVGYRLKLSLTSGVVCYPPIDRRSLRWDGCYDNHPYFELRPRFEPPRVPLVGVYLLAFVDKDYRELPLPPHVDVHVFVQVASEMCLPGRKSISRRKPRGIF